MSIDFQIRFPKGDQDIVSIFHFLVHVARPAMQGEVNADKAVREIGRIVMDPYREDGELPNSFAVVAEIKGEIVGTIGVTTFEDWYTDYKFMTNRWFFVFPALHHSGVAAGLEAEAAALCSQIGIDLVISGKRKRRLRHLGRGVIFESPPQVIKPGNAKHSMQ